MTRSPELPVELRNRPFAVAAALQAGATRTSLRRRALETPFRGVRAPAGAITSVWSRCESAAQILPSSAVFSHETAAQLLELPLPRRHSTTLDVPVDQPVEVTVPPALAQPRTRGVRGHRGLLRPDEVMELGGVLVTTPVRTWCDLAARWSLEDLVMLGDAVVAGPRRRGPTLDELCAAAAGWGPRRGARLLRQAGELVRPGVDSAPETALRLLVVRSGLPEPVVNLDVHDPDGVWLHRPDLSWPRWRAGVDYDGGHHFARGETQIRRDSIRREDLRSIGWLLPVVTASDLYRRPLVVVRRIRQALLDGGAPW